MKKIVLLFYLVSCVLQVKAQTVNVLDSPVTGANITYTLNNSGSFQYTTIQPKDVGTDAYFSANPVNSVTGQYQIYRNNGFWIIGRIICNGCTSPTINLYYQTSSNGTKPPCSNNWIPVGGGGNFNIINLSGDCIPTAPPVTSVKSSTILPTVLSVPRLIASDVAAIVSPQKGMLVYDLTYNCLKLYNGTEWVCMATN
jgi:hypothetical protein